MQEFDLEMENKSLTGGINVLPERHRTRSSQDNLPWSGAEADGINGQNIALLDTVQKTLFSLKRIQDKSGIDAVYPALTEEVGRFLGADRCFILEFENGEPFPIRYEYRSSPDVSSFTGLVPPWLYCPYLIECSRKRTAYTEDLLTNNPPEELEEFVKAHHIRGVIASPILYRDKILSCLVIHTVAPRLWSTDEIFYVKTIVSHLGVLTYQAAALKELEQISQMKSQFLANMSHEFRTPLNAILGYNEMLVNGMAGELNEKQHRFLQNAIHSTRHLMKMVDDILDYSKLERGKPLLHLCPVDLTALIDEVRNMLVVMASEKQLQLSFQVSPALEEIQADPTRFKQILINLIDNAIKFNHPGGAISVRLYPDNTGEWLIGEVQDTGIGIAEDKLTEIFNPFYQVDHTAARQHQGTGLGLSITKQLVELHGGTIAVESKVGVGTTFQFKLPI